MKLEMKGEAKMTLYPNHAELLGREIQRVRIEEAERQRLIRAAILANPTWERKVWQILRYRWSTFWNRNRYRKIYPQISAVPGKSHST